MRTLKLFIVVGLVIFGCNTKEDKSVDKISGVYVREYSFKVINPESAAEIGTRSIRDSIFILPVENGYQVSNRKWKKNDYDTEGWQSMEHSDDRPIATHFSTYDRNKFLLMGNELSQRLILDLKNERIIKERTKYVYRKIH